MYSSNFAYTLVLCICQKSGHITHSLKCKYSRVCAWSCSKHFNTNTVHYILNLEGPLQFCNVILSFNFFFFFLHSRWHCVPIFGEMPIFNFWNSHWADRVDKEGAVSKRAPSTTYSFLKATAHWIKMDGGINMTTHWRAFQVALLAPEDALRNESTHNRACTLNCRCTTQAHMINVSGKPMALDRFFFYQEIMTCNKKVFPMTRIPTQAIKILYFLKTDP